MPTIENAALNPLDPFQFLPERYREKAALGPADLKGMFDIGRKEYERLQADDTFPKPLALRTRGPRWATLAVAKWLQAQTQTQQQEK